MAKNSEKKPRINKSQQIYLIQKVEDVRCAVGFIKGPDRTEEFKKFLKKYPKKNFPSKNDVLDMIMEKGLASKTASLLLCHILGEKFWVKWDKHWKSVSKETTTLRCQIRGECDLVVEEIMSYEGEYQYFLDRINGVVLTYGLEEQVRNWKC